MSLPLSGDCASPVRVAASPAVVTPAWGIARAGVPCRVSPRACCAWVLSRAWSVCGLSFASVRERSCTAPSSVIFVPYVCATFSVRMAAESAAAPSARRGPGEGKSTQRSPVPRRSWEGGTAIGLGSCRVAFIASGLSSSPVLGNGVRGPGAKNRAKAWVNYQCGMPFPEAP